MRKRQVVRVIGPSIAYIPLTRNVFTCVDADLASDLEKFSWYAIKSRSGFYAARTERVQGKIQVISMHRHLLGLGVGDSGIADHVHGETLQNRMAELRIVTPMQNQWNRAKSSLNTSGFVGVYYDIRGSRPDAKHYYAKIKVHKKQVYLGYFTSAEEAHEAYQEASRKYFGDFKRAA
jgi:hypothetical protein